MISKWITVKPPKMPYFKLDSDMNHVETATQSNHVHGSILSPYFDAQETEVMFDVYTHNLVMMCQFANKSDGIRAVQ